jgi:two-component system chemotaxis response regulator CheB
MHHRREVRVLIIDDSAYNRKTLAEMLSEAPEIVVVGKAADGEEGLRMALTEDPDVITLDLEMPRLDGFTFLRLLRAKRPIPVIVISSHSNTENVFRALELGALDFVAKPSARNTPGLRAIRDEVVAKVRLARLLREDTVLPATPYGMNLRQPPMQVASLNSWAAPPHFSTPAMSLVSSVTKGSLVRVVAIACSTGGPGALTQILTDLPADLGAAIVIVQHMPPRFTTTFAERLDRQCAITVKEASGTEHLQPGVAYLAPGDKCLEVLLADEGLCASVLPSDGTERFVPSADRLFRSVATAAAPLALGLVLTGMGDDGAQGAVELASRGAQVVAEDETTAVIPGMPRAAVAAGAVSQVAGLHHMAEIIVAFSGRKPSV